MAAPSRVVQSSAVILTCLAALLNLYLLLAPRPSPAPAERSYTYVGDDYPELWPVSSHEDVVLTAHETRWYPIHGEDAQEMWATTSSKGFGYVRLGPEHRAFAVAMFHQLHCVRLLRAALDGRYDAMSRGHMHHCLNYIRQMILCAPNLTLEPPGALPPLPPPGVFPPSSDFDTHDWDFDTPDWDFETQRAGATHVCADWEGMYADAADNWHEWFGIVNATMVNANASVVK
ncbi:hypothetical protein C8R44DRAFT_716480 [Mycena epipterygia]|nr:hypothetical protein C8R44DRAFT_716480 [Mycena epipterygia]